MATKYSIKKLVAFGTILIVCFLALAQGSWNLGPYTFTAERPAAPLRFSLASSGGLSSYAFVSGVGGVAFSGIATPSVALAGRAIKLHYDKSMRDGRRLEVKVGSSVALADIPDWMLIPIAKFADTDFDACVSLFGPNTSATSYDIVYHESFQNTLLGLRLLQADILLFNIAETWRLPQWGGTVVLGPGEVAQPQLDQPSARSINLALRGGTFQSWVMTDQGESIVFDLAGGRLEFTGSPYYYFWNSNYKVVQAARDRLVSRALELRRAGRVADHNRLVQQINAMVPTVTEVTSLTKRLKDARGALRRFNTPVYDAATQTMRYGAFFRYVKKQNRQEWTMFLHELAPVKSEPRILTPTTWAR
ncbi:MAG TPA: hypothetical protein VEU96_11475 [Bryobacteraceae bacterium]|nr:hypothetical protein [Bryobacteraceae bacterium]